MDVADEGIRYEDDQDFSFADEELTPIESDSSQNNAEQNHEKISSNNQGKSPSYRLISYLVFS